MEKEADALKIAKKTWFVTKNVGQGMYAKDKISRNAWRLHTSISSKVQRSGKRK